ncbi:MAG: LysM peptidoglycan-binding domain-containing protein [Caldilineaceae bacterium]|nr:LysM peptidoglycan-binding domain-containing protein [Caldilineaceae bacterium]
MHHHFLSQSTRMPRPIMLGVSAALCLLAATVVILLMPTPAQAEEPVHVVGYGESLGDIANLYQVPVSELIRANQIDDPDLLHTGQRIRILGLETEAEEEPLSASLRSAADGLPGDHGYHAIQPGETALSIALAYDLTMDDLLRLNYLEDPSLLTPGQELRITARVAPLTPAAEDQTRMAATNIHIVQKGETLAEIAQQYGTTEQDLMQANGLPLAEMIYPGQNLRVHASAIPAFNTIAQGSGRKWIEVNLSTQSLTAWQGDVPVMQTVISSGLSATPTVTGRFQVGTKYSAQRMYGPGYDIPDVPWVMYFYSGYAIHGAYWHTNFGAPASHGCVNMRPAEAKLLWDWAPAGTEVWVHY